jgi:hypothetical protein
VVGGKVVLKCVCLLDAISGEQATEIRNSGPATYKGQGLHCDLDEASCEREHVAGATTYSALKCACKSPHVGWVPRM